MSPRDPMTQLPTHEVTNQPPPRGDDNAFETDLPLREAVKREAPPWVADYLLRFGAQTGSEHCRELGFLANENPPRLRAFDRYGQRIDEVEYHPAYHELMALAVEHDVHSIAWQREGDGGAVAHVAALYLLTQPEQGVCCPITMTHAVVPALRQQPDVASEWESRILSNRYDPRVLPATEKTGVTFGMAMTEKQGGSDVRANRTQARKVDQAGGYELTGHKWFCSAPMSDAFLTLAQTDEGLSCFLVPRWRPDGTRNPFFIQRLKDKLGNRSNASSEIEYHGTYGILVGEPGRGVPTIIEMVHQTRLDAATAPAGMMRHALVEALHHARHRSVFGKRLSEQPLMRNVLADLALEVEAATAMTLRVARAFDESGRDETARAFARIATAVTKFWTNKRAPQFIYEAMECLGGSGYVEESVLPRLYREAPVNSIWEGSGNVMCLDVLRALQRTPEAGAAFVNELQEAAGGNRHLDAAIQRLQAELTNTEAMELRARRITELMAVSLQASLLVRHAPPAIAGAFCASRLGGESGTVYGGLSPNVDMTAILQRAVPV